QSKDLEGIAAVLINDAVSAGGDKTEAGVIGPVAEEEDRVVTTATAVLDAGFNQGGANSLSLILRQDGQGPERGWLERMRRGGPDGNGTEEHMADDFLIDTGNELEEDPTVGAERVEQGVVLRVAEGELIHVADGGVVGRPGWPN